jgi:hypothetical protein
MNQVFTIDPGFDQEIQELEEFMNPMKIMEPLRWSTTIPHLDKLLIAAPGLSAQLFTKGLELVSVLLLEKSHLKLARPGYQKVMIFD